MKINADEIPVNCQEHWRSPRSELERRVKVEISWKDCSENRGKSFGAKNVTNRKVIQP